MDDVPPNVRESVRDLISCCLVKDAAIRPSAKQIRNHQSFQMLSKIFFSPHLTVLSLAHSYTCRHSDCFLIRLIQKKSSVGIFFFFWFVVVVVVVNVSFVLDKFVLVN